MVKCFYLGPYSIITINRYLPHEVGEQSSRPVRRREDHSEQVVSSLEEEQSKTKRAEETVSYRAQRDRVSYVSRDLPYPRHREIGHLK
jgi:hypothetical protein